VQTPLTVLRNTILDWLRRCWQRPVVRVTLGLVAVLLLLDAAFPVKTDVPYSTIVTAEDGSVLHTYLSRDDKWRLYAQLSDITPALRNALIFKEDRYFYYHPGINPVALLRAAGRNLLTGRRTSGASTITMQVVRALAQFLVVPRPIPAGVVRLGIGRWLDQGQEMLPLEYVRVVFLDNGMVTVVGPDGGENIISLS
jgi:Transglycosylase